MEPPLLASYYTHNTKLHTFNLLPSNVQDAHTYTQAYTQLHTITGSMTDNIRTRVPQVTLADSEAQQPQQHPKAAHTAKAASRTGGAASTSAGAAPPVAAAAAGRQQGASGSVAATARAARAEGVSGGEQGRKGAFVAQPFFLRNSAMEAETQVSRA